MAVTKPFAFEWDPARADAAFRAKRATPFVFRFTLERESVPINLTGKTIRFNMARESPVGSGIFVTEIGQQTATITNATAGQGEFAASGAQMTVPVGDHAIQIDILDGATVVERVPDGNSYMRAIIGEAIGG